jgi:hypothetical protein
MRDADSMGFNFFVLILVFSLIYAGILNTAAIGTDAFAKKGSRKISDRNNNDGNGRASGSSDKGSSFDGKDTSFKGDTKPTEPIVPQQVCNYKL